MVIHAVGEWEIDMSNTAYSVPIIPSRPIALEKSLPADLSEYVSNVAREHRIRPWHDDLTGLLVFKYRLRNLELC